MTFLKSLKQKQKSKAISYKRHLRKRHFKDEVFRRVGRLIALLALLFLVVFIGGLVYWAQDAFYRYEVELDLPSSLQDLSPPFFLQDGEGQHQRPHKLLGSMLSVYTVQDEPFEAILAPSWHRRLFKVMEEAKESPPRHQKLVSLPLEDSLDKALKKGGALSSFQASFIHQMKKENRLTKVMRLDFLTHSDSRDPQVAGIFSGFVSTLFLFCLTLGLSFPVAVLSALYLEEFAKPNRLTRLIEVNIANLASVPSVVFGLLGLAIFINFFGLPRSSSLVGGLTLSLMTLPTIIVASRSAIKSVPKSLRQAARGMGASDMQVVLHHVFPMALPGIITGTLIALARSLGETAPLLMVGMMAFIVDVPQSLLDPAAPLPVQIFSWVRNPEIGFLANASAAILALLLFLGSLNVLAIYLRGKYEHKW